MWHCEVRDGLLVMKMSNMLFCLVGVVIICSVWVVRSMSKKRMLMSTGYECPCMVQFGQLMSWRLRSPPTQSTEFLCLDVRYSTCPRRKPFSSPRHRRPVKLMSHYNQTIHVVCV